MLLLLPVVLALLQAGLAVCLSALQSPSCPGSAVFAHLWMPVCAALLLVPSSQYSSQHGEVLQQHQAPGIMRMLPVLQQMADLQHRVTEAAANLVATALQVWLGLHMHAALVQVWRHTRCNAAEACDWHSQHAFAPESQCGHAPPQPSTWVCDCCVSCCAG
jgi:hypothetical protein